MRGERNISFSHIQSHQYLTIYGRRAAHEADTEQRCSAKLYRRLNPIFPPSHNWNSSQLLELNIYLKKSFKLLDSFKAQLCFVPAALVVLMRRGH